jgi:hypothetical protein
MRAHPCLASSNNRYVDRRRLFAVVSLLLATVLLQTTLIQKGFVGQILGKEDVLKSSADDYDNTTDVPKMQDPNKHEVTANNTATSPPVLTAFSEMRMDRSGMAVKYMLFAHSYCRENGLEYGGACLKAGASYKYKHEHERLLVALGLDQVFLPFPQCPNAATGKKGQTNSFILKDTLLGTKNTGTFTPEWIQDIQANASAARPPVKAQYDIVVHIRRGDVNPCSLGVDYRYLPNSHYVAIIKELLKERPDANVTVFSESESFESWDPFQKYDLVLDADIAKVWNAMMSARVLVMSKSSFSLVPALLGNASVIYTPFWNQPLPSWQVVSKDIQIETTEELRLLKKTCPKAYSKMRNDRPEEAVKSMLLAHAYCRQTRVIFGGSCLETNVSYPFLTVHKKLLRVMGLDKILLLFNPCPTTSGDQERTNSIILEDKLYAEKEISLWHKTWAEDIRSTASAARQPVKEQYDIVVHIRRGNVTPCTQYSREYLPNSYYVAILKTLLQERPDANVTIFSESKSYENWKPFQQYTLVLDADIADVWKGIVSARVLVLSKGDLAIVPAILSDAKVVYIPSGKKWWPHWQVVSKYAQDKATKDMSLLKIECPQ